MKKKIFSILAVTIATALVGASVAINNNYQAVKAESNNNSYIKEYNGTFTFNDNFNYNAFFQNDWNGPIYSEAMVVSVPKSAIVPNYIFKGDAQEEDWHRDFVYRVGNFTFGNNQTIYNYIIARYTFTHSPDFVQEANGSIHDVGYPENNHDYWYVTFTGLYYGEPVTAGQKYLDHAVQVVSRDMVNVNGSWYYPYDAYWINPTARTINIDYIINGNEYKGPYNPETNLLSMLEFCNYTNSNINLPSTEEATGTLAGSFAILGNAFTAVSSLFGIVIVPGITIGMLLFLPLMVGIIIAIVWLVKR